MGPVIYEYYSGSEGAGMTHATPEDAMKYPGTVGKALMGIIHVCDEDGKELPIGNIGKIILRVIMNLLITRIKRKVKKRCMKTIRHGSLWEI